MQRWYHFLFLLVMIGLVILPTAATSQTPLPLTLSVGVNPTSGPSGTPVTLTVRFGTPGTSAAVNFSNGGTDQVAISAIGTGTLSNYPLYGSAGTVITITVTDGGNTPRTASTTFTVLPLTIPRIPRFPRPLLVSTPNFVAPNDAVMSDDGGTVYFSAKSTEGATEDTLPAAIFTVPSGGSDAIMLASGTPCT